MKTRDRILLCTLELFNEHGEPNVTTLDIANELDISPGNLYYHFRGKEALLECLVEQFLDHTRDLLEMRGDPQQLEPEDYWLFMHLLFEAITDFRFLFQDLSNLTGRYDFIRRAMQHWLAALRGSLNNMLMALREQGHLIANDADIQRLLDALCQTFVFWLDFQRVTRREDMGPSQAVQQVLGLMLPYLDEPSQAWMRNLIDRYS